MDDTKIITKNEISRICEQIIINPNENLKELKPLIDIGNELADMAVAKVFSNICPLYKIRLGSQKIKHKSTEFTYNDFDITLLKLYETFLKKILRKKNEYTYHIAAYLLDELDHFNYSDRLVSKVLLGTQVDNVRNICIYVITERIKNDNNGKILVYILDQSIDYNFNENILDALLKSQYLNSIINNYKNIHNSKNIQNNLENEFRKNKFFAKKQLKGINKKIEKERYLKELNIKKDEIEELTHENIKIRNKAINSLQRLYFTLLKEKNVRYIQLICTGIQKFFSLIRQEFHEGLLFLLSDNIKDNYTNIKYIENNIELINTIFIVFKDSGIDFENLVMKIVPILDFKFAKSLSKDYFETKVMEILETIFLKNKMQKELVLIVAKKLILLRTMRYLTNVDKFIKKIEIVYNLNYREKYATNNNRVKTIYEYFLYKKTV
ncbi:hypothetical protein EBI_24868 [Enterocytozoon bieneusi H348]|nr:hypothetical protein EBI_24868 [Enterocytozoon bieneusi H348]|eukprot:XP_002649449.1 hypothetical protein EBI_24868 [Enterocytozoon bieneusi H348]